jgi:hypothetical protein
MPWAQAVNPYVDTDPRESYVTVREYADLLNMTQDRVIELAKRGTLRSRCGLVQPALIPGYTA